MTTTRSIGGVLAVAGLVVASRLADSPLARGIRDVALIYLSVDFLLQARAGYLRRRPHWTPESWRRYFTACTVPVGALAVVVVMMAALDWRLPIVGQAGSTARGVWAVGTMFFVLVGGGGLAMALGWLTGGEATQQFAGPKWFRSDTHRRKHDEQRTGGT